MRAAVFTALLCCGCMTPPPPPPNPCVTDPTTGITIRPAAVKMRPGDRLTFDYEIRSKRGSATAEASISAGTLEPAGTNAVWLTAPPLPGTYQLMVTRVGCPLDSTSATITVEPLASLGKAPGQQPVPSGVAWSPDGAVVAVSGRGGVWLFRADGTFLDSAKLPHQGKTSVTYSPDGAFLVVGGDVEERSWVLKTDGLTPWTRLGFSRGSAGALFSEDGAELYLHEGDRLRAFSMTTGAMRDLGPVSQTTMATQSVPRLQHGPLGSLLVTVPGELRELSTGRRLARWAGGAAVEGVAISPAAKWVLTSGGGLRLPFVEQGLSIGGQATGPGGAFFSAQLSRDGALLATGGTGGVNVYRNDGAALTGVGGATLMGAPGPVLDVAWSPDGSRLAVASSARLIILTRQQLGL